MPEAFLTDPNGTRISPSNPLPTAIVNATAVRGAVVAASGGNSSPIAGSTVEIPLLNASSIAVQITDTFSATLQFEAALQDEISTNWFAVAAVPVGGGAPVTSTTTTGTWQVGNPGWTKFRVRCSSWSSGDARVTLSTSIGAGPPSGGSTSWDLLATSASSATARRGSNVYKDQNAAAIGSIATVWTPAANKTIRFMGGTISCNTAVSVLFEDNAANSTVFRTPVLGANTPYTFTVGDGLGFLLGAANNVLKGTSSAGANMTGTLWGTEE